MSEDPVSQVQTMRPIRESEPLDRAAFEASILKQGEPVVIRGLLKEWPMVEAARDGVDAACDYLKGSDAGVAVEVLWGDASIKGEYFYTDDMSTVNFRRGAMPFKKAVDFLSSRIGGKEAVFMQSIPVEPCLPKIHAENVLPLIDDAIKPNIWIGNETVVRTHYDVFDNLACVIAGRRRFTLFPPDAVADLYVGPLERTPSGTPVSMVSLRAPDFERYPKFRKALAKAQQAELYPGDVIFIPYLWWHNVEALDPFNILMSYWWNDEAPSRADATDAFFHSLLAMRALPAHKREAWRAFFEHYLFAATPADHIPQDKHGLLGTLTDDQAEALRKRLAANLQS